MADLVTERVLGRMFTVADRETERVLGRVLTVADRETEWVRGRVCGRELVSAECQLGLHGGFK